MSQERNRQIGLDEILVHKKHEVQAKRARAQALIEYLQGRQWPEVIPDLKFRSPQEGLLYSGSLQVLVSALEKSGVKIVSVHTDENFFGGSRYRLSHVSVLSDFYIIQKDEIIDPSQIDTQADAVIFIKMALQKEKIKLQPMLDISRVLGVVPIVEVNSSQELKSVLVTDAQIIAVNCRNLQTNQIDKVAALKLLEEIPQDRVKMYFSAIETKQDVKAAYKGGAKAVLVGTALFKAEDPVAKLQELTGQI